MIRELIDEVKKNKGAIAVAIVIIISIPLIAEGIILLIPDYSSFSDETWFSFMGSYIGAVVTLIVMFATIIKTTHDNRKEIIRQNDNREKELKRQKDKYEAEQEIKLAENVMETLLLNKYNFNDVNCFLPEYHRYCKDVFENQVRIAQLIYDEDNIKTEKDKFYKELHEIETVQREYILLFQSGKIENNDEAEKAKSEIDQKIMSLISYANGYRNDLIDMYYKYVKEMKAKEFQ